MPAPSIDRVVVVGGGISGLTAGILLAEAGARVTLVEQHTIPGGYLQSFRRNGVRYEVGFHQVGSVLPGEVFARYLSVLGVYGDLKLLPFRDDALFRVVLTTGERVDIPRGAGPIAASLKRRYPDEAAGIDGVIAEIDACVHSSPWLGLSRDTVDLDVYQRAMQTSLAEVVEARLRARGLREAFYSFNFNTTLPPDRCPFGIYAFTFNVLTTSCARIEGGGAVLIGALEKRFRSLGGTLILGRGAERLDADGKHARALELDDGSRLELDLLLSTCHPAETVRFCGRDRFSPLFLETLDALEQTRGSFKVYCEMDGPVASIGPAPLFILDDDPSWEPGIYVVSPSALDPSYGDRHVLEMLCWQDFRAVEAWQETRFGRRPKDYTAFKERLADGMMGRVEREIPGIRGHIVRRHTSSPLTNLHYTRSVRGGAMGASQDVEHQGNNHLRPRNRLRNVFLSGQSLGTPGIVGCVINAARLCDEIVPGMDLLRRLREVTF